MTGREDIKIQIPEKAAQVLEKLHEAGYEAYVVGGCVRDSLLHRTPQDWDITTSALPGQVKELFRCTIDTGIQHGTVTVMIDKEGFEVTTYRIDGKYEDSRHPSGVTFTPSLEEDLKRRDFTVNAMAYNEEDGLVDFYGGMEDMENGVIRCVGEPDARFGEDALRILRAIRFSAQLGYRIDERTKESIRALAPTLANISAERIRTELVKLLISDHPDYLRIAWETGVTGIILPEFDRCMDTAQKHPHHCCSVGEHTLKALVHVPAEKNIRMAMLLHDMGKPDALETDEDGITHFHGHAQISERIAKNILTRLKFDNDSIARICRLVSFHDYGDDLTWDKKSVRRALNRIGLDAFPDLFAVKRGDILSQSEFLREEKLAGVDLWQELYEQIMEEKQCVTLKMLAINGSDLIRLGMKPGREMGQVLNRLLEQVLEDPERNNKKYLTEQALRMLS